MAGKKAGPAGFGRAVQWMAGFFYANNGLLASPRTARIQTALDILTRMFERVILQTNINKTVRMV